ncbi:NAD(P)/FAD-dependent oxidoreductase [Conexibacter sp. DBS9H8]|uniref:dihydrolipoyl dehydrogenase family protein n=1 Tax=Conexibacter sp. DBS9H8 TaxID=2937801 RepID=UPI00273A6A75|nr:FAD-dependent oxidoreductase [Conexibacter sp. DBS9H8]
MRSRRYDLVVVGGGTGGLVSAIIAGQLGARVALIERDRMGGDCLWTGCVPSKALIAAAAAAHTMRTADRFGLSPVVPAVDLAAVMASVRETIATLAVAESPERLREHGVEAIPAHGRFLGPNRLDADGVELGWRSAIIATGSTPALPPIRGIGDVDPLTNESVWDLDALPARLLVIGGGTIGCELAQAFARLGAAVTIVEAAPRLLAREDPTVSELILGRLRAEGVTVHLDAQPREISRTPEGCALELTGEPTRTIVADRVLVATGRRARTDGLALERIGVAVAAGEPIHVDTRLRTDAAGVYAVGDVTGLAPFTHVAAHHARVATPNALFHTRSRVQSIIPHVTFTDPEVAQVGMSSAEARDRWGSAARILEHADRDLDRAVTARSTDGFTQLITDPRRRLVGATVCGPSAGETIAELTAWILNAKRVHDLSRSIHAYPTFSEGPARAADDFLAEELLSGPVRRVARGLLGVLRVLPAGR